MPETAPTILLTGFGPFPGVQDNASAILARRLAAAARRAHPLLRVRSSVLPTEWERAPRRINHLVRCHRPCLVVHFGVSHKAAGFQIETVGRNACAPRADAAGRLPRGPLIAAEGPDIRASGLPTDAILVRLAAAGVPAQASDDAGGYLCNAVLYHSLAAADAAGGVLRTGFVHVPDDLGRPGSTLSWEAALAGGLVILAACLDAATT